MANQKKVEAVKGLLEKIKKANAIVLVDYKGIKVSEDTEVRKNFREAEVEYIVAKNRLFKIALQEAGVEDSFDDVLEGTTAFAFSYGDVVAPAKIAYEFGKGKDIFNIKAGYIEGKRVELAEIEALAKLPSREGLLGQVAGSLMSIITKVAYAVNAVKESKEGQEEQAE
ncbi:50S ribosomal protein L10 [Haliovirga abyssi]|uniref:Large ribosomal subunit protein uL10 n=1 Tax=Haliovirga abyssi TaxID=2996794 RepID=A0AAU9DCR3_9FUSO|nr:50S ribosomal protein L10 [Haliovirga abyssi]BDU51291.1 50S ribosomal protein L10 [Haliovirga abyssi]